MFVNINEYTKFLTKHKLTPGQFLALYLLHIKKPKLITAYRDALGASVISPEEKDDLFKRGYMIEERNNIRVTEKFSMEFISNYDAANEAWDAYPAYSISNGNTYPLKNMSITVFADLYEKVHKGVPDEHHQFVEDVKYGVMQGLIKVKLFNFMESRAWVDLRKMRNTANGGDTQSKPSHNEF